MKVITVTWICDLCGTDEKNLPEKEGLPKGWIQLTLDHPIEERCWVDKNICPDCAKKVVAKVTQGK
jgi:hypothetical protein